MLLLFSTPTGKHAQYFIWGLHGRSIVYGFMFIGFTHIGLAACTKQLKYEKLKKYAIPLVLITSLMMATFAEYLMISNGIQKSMRVWNFISEFVGIIAGIGTFKLLYRNCY